MLRQMTGSLVSIDRRAWAEYSSSADEKGRTWLPTARTYCCCHRWLLYCCLLAKYSGLIQSGLSYCLNCWYYFRKIYCFCFGRYCLSAPCPSNWLVKDHRCCFKFSCYHRPLPFTATYQQSVQFVDFVVIDAHQFLILGS